LKNNNRSEILLDTGKPGTQNIAVISPAGGVLQSLLTVLMHLHAN